MNKLYAPVRGKKEGKQQMNLILRRYREQYNLSGEYAQIIIIGKALCYIAYRLEICRNGSKAYQYYMRELEIWYALLKRVTCELGTAV